MAKTCGMILYIKYMVSQRCKMMVKDQLTNLGLHFAAVELGYADVIEKITPCVRKQLKENLLISGLEVLDDKKAILIERIKSVVIQMIHYDEDELPAMNYSHFIADKLGYNYTYLANIFSEAQGTTIQHYIILNKIERVKELLIYGDLNLTEISYKLNYSSVAHLSTQFKKVTGLTPSYYKHNKNKQRQVLENI
jgi:AraC-like DNA-binding protein